MCVCDDKQVGNEVILKSAETAIGQNETAFLDLAICRDNKWQAGIHAWMTVKGKRGPFLIVQKPINYCPMCGRRLSLGDAERRNDG